MQCYRCNRNCHAALRMAFHERQEVKKFGVMFHPVCFDCVIIGDLTSGLEFPTRLLMFKECVFIVKPDRSISIGN
jgi:hypothetical protein